MVELGRPPCSVVSRVSSSEIGVPLFFSEISCFFCLAAARLLFVFVAGIALGGGGIVAGYYGLIASGP